MTQPSSPQDPGRGNLIRIRNLRAAALNGQGLASALPAGFNGRWTRRHWAHASLFAMLGTLVMAIVPGFSNAMSTSAEHAAATPPFTTTSLLLPPLPAAARKAPVEENHWQLVTVAQGETLSHVFERLQLPGSDLQRVLAQPGARDTLRRLHPGTELAFDLRPAAGGKPAALRAFRYDRDDLHRVELHVAGDKVIEKVIERPVEVRTAVVSGKVGRSLFHTARKLGLSGNNIRSITDRSEERRV